jgi:hypothetical protein
MSTGAFPSQSLRTTHEIASGYSYTPAARLLVYSFILIVTLLLALIADLALHIPTQDVTYGCVILIIFLMPISSIVHIKFSSRRHARITQSLAARQLAALEELEATQQSLRLSLLEYQALFDLMNNLQREQTTRKQLAEILGPRGPQQTQEQIPEILALSYGARTIQ